MPIVPRYQLRNVIQFKEAQNLALKSYQFLRLSNRYWT